MALFGADGWLFGSKGALYLGATVPGNPGLGDYPFTPGPLPPSNSPCPCCCNCPSIGGSGSTGSYKTTKTLTISNVNIAAALGTCWTVFGGLFSYRFNSVPVNGTFTLTLRAQYRSFGTTVACYYGLDIPASSDQWVGLGCSGVLQFHCSVLHFELVIVPPSPDFDGFTGLIVYLTNPAAPLIGIPPVLNGNGQGAIVAGEDYGGSGAPFIPYMTLGPPLPCGGSIVAVSNNPPTGPNDNFGGFGGFSIPPGGFFGGKFVVTDA
ncbi:MAG TPA: hypothetical protein VK797_22710 [Tepidisphaeraceae bacterium]|jgi:hypothetical protein|nr:hypothetical protein [Tepidisphaeraceae bacterium]